MKYFIEALKKYGVFTGRARRSEYWYFVLFCFIFAFAILMLGYFLESVFGIQNEGDNLGGLAPILYFAYILAMIVPFLAVAVRRLHDIGKSGWFFFIYFVPLIGGIWLLILLFTDSQPGLNKWGPNPKEPLQPMFDFERPEE